MIFIIITVSFIVWVFNKYYCSFSKEVIPLHEWKYFINNDNFNRPQQFRRCTKCNKIEDAN